LNRKDDHEKDKETSRKEIQKRAKILYKLMNHDAKSDCPMVIILGELARLTEAIRNLESARSNQRYYQDHEGPPEDLDEEDRPHPGLN